MEAVTIVTIVFGSILIALFIVTSMISKVIGTHGGSQLSDKESQLMQELFYGMKKMEERVESLETILLEKGRGQ